MFSLLLFSNGIIAQETFDLQVEFPNGEQCRVVANYEYHGDVIVIPPANEDSETKEPNKANLLPLVVKANLTYFQRMTGDQQAVRFYESASADIKIDKGSANPKLTDSNRLIIARLKSDPGEQVELASIADTLQQSELELIRNPADPLTLSRILTKSKLSVGDKWEPAKEDLAKLLGVHKIKETNVELMLKKLDDKSARVYLMGTVAAEVNDATTSMDLSGIAIIDLKTKMVSSFKLGVRESRNPGQIAPGFDGKTKIDMQITTDVSTPKLSNAELTRQAKSSKIRQRLKWESEVGHFMLTYEPRWKMIATEPDAAVLRFIDQGELLAQCNIVQLPSRPADKPLGLEEYKTEVGKIVAADDNARLLKASTLNTKNGLTALRVTVAGEEEGLPVNWYYYHIAGKDGRQVTFVFTLAESVATRVSGAAEQLVNEFLFHPQPKKVAKANPGPKQPSPQPSSNR